MTALRSRTNLPPKNRPSPSTHSLTAEDGPLNSVSTPKAYVSDADEGPSRLSLLDVLRILGGLFLLSSTLSYFITGYSISWGYRPAVTRPARIRAWLVRNSCSWFLPAPLLPISIDRLAANKSLFPAWSLRSDRRPIDQIQWHRSESSHPRRRQLHHLRRLRLPALLRPRR